MNVSMAQVFKAVDYANRHPYKYLNGTTNWCAAVAFDLNRQAYTDPQPPVLGGEPEERTRRTSDIRDEAYDNGWNECRDAYRAHLAPLQAEIERLKDNVSEVTTYRDNAIKKIERLRNELTGTEKERDQLKARCDELEKALHLAKPIVLHEKEKLLKMEAAFPKGFDSSEAVKAFEALDSTLPKPAGSEKV